MSSHVWDSQEHGLSVHGPLCRGWVYTCITYTCGSAMLPVLGQWAAAVTGCLRANAEVASKPCFISPVFLHNPNRSTHRNMSEDFTRWTVAPERELESPSSNRPDVGD